MNIQLGRLRSPKSEGATRKVTPSRKTKTPPSRRRYESSNLTKPVADGGRLVAIAATGPVYRSELVLEVAPVSVTLAFIQELASRMRMIRAPTWFRRGRRR